jgi:hypothetical protein
VSVRANLSASYSCLREKYKNIGFIIVVIGDNIMETINNPAKMVFSNPKALYIKSVFIKNPVIVKERTVKTNMRVNVFCICLFL